MKAERGVYSAEITPDTTMDPIVTITLRGPLSKFKGLVEYITESTEEQVPYHLYSVLSAVVRGRE